MIKRLLLILSFGTLLLSCSDDENKTEPTNSLEIGLRANKAEANIFELVTFNLTLNQSATLLDIRNTYDSLIWKIPQLGHINLLTKNNFNLQWSHNFMLTGHYDAILQGYKNDKVITSDTVSISIKNDRDFLCYNWADIKEGPISLGYTDIFENTDFTTVLINKNNILSIELYSQHNALGDLSSLITSLYSKPIYTTDNEVQLLEKFDELFKINSETITPISIWITPKTKIVLVKIDENGYSSNYKIHAEAL